MVIWFWLLKHWRLVLFVSVVTYSAIAMYGRGYRIATEEGDRKITKLQVAHDRVISNLNAVHSAALLAETNRRLDVERARVQDMNALDARFTEELNDAKREADDLVAAVRADERRLRNRFTCPAATGSAGSGTSPGASVGDAGEESGLRTADAEFLIRLAAEADQVVTQLRACQAIVAADRD